ncbi:MAG: cobalamin-binding protein [Tissierellaceae bacterium]
MKKLKGLALFLSLLILVVTISGCTQNKGIENELKVEDSSLEDSVEIRDEGDFPVVVEDTFGNVETIEQEPMKIISLAPSNTEVLFELGLGDRVMGVTSYCDYPEEAKTKEVIGDFSGNNLERIIELNPDLVLVYGSGDEDENRIMRDAGIKVLGFMSESLSEIVDDIKTIGKATGKEKEAEELVSTIVAKKDSIVELVKGENEVRVFYEIWHDPLMGAGKGSFMDELITLAGGTNIADDADGAYPQYDLEQLIERDPEIYLSAHDMEDKTVESIKERPGYSVMTAIINNRVHLFYNDEADIVSRPGPRISEALEIVAKAIHPQLFE